MAAKSKHWAEVNRWLCDVIESMTATKQIPTVSKLLTAYRKLYINKADSYENFINDYTRLREILEKKIEYLCSLTNKKLK